MGGINVGRWLAGGVLAGIVTFVIEGIASVSYMEEMEAALAARGLSMEMTGVIWVLTILVSLILGLVLVFFYLSRWNAREVGRGGAGGDDTGEPGGRMGIQGGLTETAAPSRSRSPVRSGCYISGQGSRVSRSAAALFLPFPIVGDFANS
jgi:hypothetical protein